MAKARWSAGLVTAGLLALGLCVPAPAQTGDKFSPTYKSRPEDIAGVLGYRPRQPGIDYSQPTAEEQKSCTMKLILGDRPNSTGWLMLDPQGRPLRRFFDSNGDGKIDVLSYYKDGVEVYREMDTKFNDKVPPDQYRWFNTGGSKWGVDLNQDGKIDTWRMISAEEAAQEAFLAITTRDFNRLKALFITDGEVAALKLPEAQATRIREAQARASAEFTKMTEKLAQTTFVRVEGAVPQCVPADGRGPVTDVLRFTTRDIMFETAAKKPDWAHTGEMIQVGTAWRLTEVPSLEDSTTPPPPSDGLKKLMEDLGKVDKEPVTADKPGKNQKVLDYNLKRVGIIEQIHAQVSDAKDKETWMRQILDNLCTAQQANVPDMSVLSRLAQHRDQLAKAGPGSNLAGYAHFRELWARFAPRLAPDVPGMPKEDLGKVQKEWHEELAKFVQLYPKAEDTPDALLQLGMNCEFGGKEDEAKGYYSTLAANFTEHPLAARAKGAATRLSLNGQPLQLTGPALQGGTPFDIAKLSGKVVVVYYWASYCKSCVGDFAQLKQLQATHKNLEIVTVNLDERSEDATRYLQQTPVPGVTLFQAQGDQTGLNSPLGTQYGVMGLPTLFLVGKDGRVINRSIQVNELDDAVRKAL
jgi:thiol-disulfide isomerase/thioredoxin